MESIVYQLNILDKHYTIEGLISIIEVILLFLLSTPAMFKDYFFLEVDYT